MKLVSKLEIFARPSSDTPAGARGGLPVDAIMQASANDFALTSRFRKLHWRNGRMRMGIYSARDWRKSEEHEYLKRFLGKAKRKVGLQMPLTLAANTTLSCPE